jgi:hypothetical protein
MRWMQVLIAVDQLANTLIGGWADETISSRSWRMEQRATRWACSRRWIDAVFRLCFGQQDHCFGSYTSEQVRTHFPPELRDQIEAHK